MARGVNKVILVGNVGGDPETRYLPNGNAVTNVTLATSESWKDKQTGQQQERTEWHRVVFFGRLAEIVAEYVRKGSQIYVEGSLRTRKWQGQDGQDRYTTEVVVAEDSPAVGRNVRALESAGDDEIEVVTLLRRGQRRHQPAGDVTLMAGDILILQGEPDALEGIVGSQKLQLSRDHATQIALMCATALAFAALSDGTYAMLSGRAGHLLSQRRVRLMSKFSGSLLIGGGLWLASTRAN